jgi:hypothetical protein
MQSFKLTKKTFEKLEEVFNELVSQYSPMELQTTKHNQVHACNCGGGCRGGCTGRCGGCGGSSCKGGFSIF